MQAGIIKNLIIPLGLAVALSGCGLYSKDDWPTLAGPGAAPVKARTAPLPSPPPPVPPAAGPRQATLVARLVQHGTDFDRLTGVVDGLAAAYRADADGLTADSPIADWNKAQIGLSRLQGQLFEVKRLGAILAEDIARGVYLLAGRRLEGAVLDGGRLYGRVNDFYQNRRAFALAQSSRLAALRGGATGAEERRALVVIRFTTAEVAFEDGLAGAVAAARRRRPDVAFEVVAAAPAQGAQMDAALERVLRALIDLDVEPARISHLTAAGLAAPEVRVYVK